ncbi:MAG: hypothetical protein LBL78_03090 [Prevotellaceae bacterium]|jgi:hypothetical protein|nr:hypothetical protein [Prevotellaceae bacterium]
MEEKQLNEQESLELITRMIQNTRSKVTRGAGNPLLIWGYSTVIIGLSVWYLLSVTGDYRWNFLWFIMAGIGAITGYKMQKQPKSGVSTYINKIIKYVWWVLGAGCVLLSVAAAFIKLPILFLVLLLVGMGVTITGLIVSCNIVTLGGVLGCIASFVCFLLPPIDGILVFVLMFVVMCVIPGHVLNYQIRKGDV